MASDGLGRAHPRLFGLTVVGALLLAAGALLGLLGGGAGTGRWAVRLGFGGFVLLVFGVAGYVALGVFERQPGP